LPPDLLESELFGHEAGAYTGATQARPGLFEVAADGTIFLDEVGDMPLQLQVKLLRALQEHEIKRLGGARTIKVNPRIICATNKPVDKLIESGRMREDFFFRIAVISLTIPPLRERPEDISLLLQHYIKFFGTQMSKPGLVVTPVAQDILLSYPWPGNARELENVVERAVLLAEREILPEHLGIDFKIDFSVMDEARRSLQEVAEQATRRAETEMIVRTLRRTHGNKSKAAALLGVSYKTLLNKVKQYELEEEHRETAQHVTPET
jgi:transcriptional regulator with PAS, ATPase and Fis domain